MKRLISAGLILTLSGFTLGQVREENVIAAIDPVTESRLGELWLEQKLEKMGITKNQEYIEVVNRIGHNILSAINDRPDLDDWKFIVVESGEKNAFALPGGKIVVLTGEIEFDKTGGKIDEEMLASTIGHEIAHVTQRHSIKGMSARQSFDWVLQHLDSIEEKVETGKLSAEELEKLQAIGQARFTRVQEFEADQLGALYAALAGYGYSGGIRWAQRLIDSGQDFSEREYLEPVKKEGSLRAVDHPTFSERIAGMREFQKTLLSVAGEFNWGYQLLQSGNYDKAINCFKDVVKVFPKSFQAWNNLAKAHHMRYLQQQDASGAKTQLKEKFQCDLVDYSVNLRGRVRGPQDLSRAIEYYKEAQRMNPTELGVQSNLAVALAQTKESAKLIEAEQILRTVLSLAPSNPMYLNHMGITLYLKNEQGGVSKDAPGEVLDYFNKAASQNYPPAMYNLGILYLESGKDADAKNLLLEYIKRDSESPWNQMARSLLQQRDVQIPDLPSPKFPQVTSVLNIKLGAPRDEVLKTLGAPERTEKVKTTQDDSGEILYYETSGTSFVLSEGRVMAINLFRPQTARLNIADIGNVKSPLPEISRVAIDSSTEDLVKAFGEPMQSFKVEGGGEEIFSYWNDEIKVDFRLQLARVRAISVIKM